MANSFQTESLPYFQLLRRQQQHMLLPHLSLIDDGSHNVNFVNDNSINNSDNSADGNDITSRNTERRKEKSRDAARCRRSRETKIFSDLAAVLPLPCSVVQHLDKASVVRVAISYLKIKAVLLKAAPDDGTAIMISSNKIGNQLTTTEKATSGGTNGNYDDSDDNDDDKTCWQKNLDSLFLNALEGFLVIISSEGDVIFISDNVERYLGLSQVEILGQSIYELSHPCDHSEIKDILTPKTDFETDQKCFFSRMKCTLTSKGRNLNIKSATYKVIQYTGHLVKDRGNQSISEKEHVEIERFSECDEDDYCDGTADIEDVSGGCRISENKERSTGANPQSYFIAIGEPVPHPGNLEIPLGQSTFLSKHMLDMKFTYADDKINEFLGYNPESMIKKSVFDYYHAEDTLIIKQSFKNLFQKGQSQTERYRFLALGGGYAWVLTQATLLYQEKGQKPHSVVCVNFVISGIEEKHCVFSLCQLEEYNGNSVDNNNNNNNSDNVAKKKDPSIIKTNRCYSREPTCRTLTDKLHDLVVSPERKSRPSSLNRNSESISSTSSSSSTLPVAKSATAAAVVAASLRKPPPQVLPSIVITAHEISENDIHSPSSSSIDHITSAVVKTDSELIKTTPRRSRYDSNSKNKSNTNNNTTVYLRPFNHCKNDRMLIAAVHSSSSSSLNENVSTANVDEQRSEKVLTELKSVIDNKSASISDRREEELITPIPEQTSSSISCISKFILDQHNQTGSPKSNTSNVFVPIKEDMNKGFLPFIDDSDDAAISTILDDEPEDLTHLAPTAGDVCVPLHSDNDSLSYILPDMLDDIMLSNCNLLSARLNDNSDNELHSNHSTSPYFRYNELRDSSSSRPVSPMLSHSGEDSNLPSLNGGDSPIYSRNSSINSFLDFGLATSEDMKGLSARAPLVPFCLDQDTVLPLIANDFMWGSSSTDSSNWSSLSNSPRSNCSLSPNLESSSSLAKLLREDDQSLSPFSNYDDESSSLIKDALELDHLNDIKRIAVGGNSQNRDRNDDDRIKNNGATTTLSVRRRINDNDNHNIDQRHDRLNCGLYDRDKTVTANITVTNVATKNNNAVNLFKRRYPGGTNVYNGKRGHSYVNSNNVSSGVLKSGIDRKRPSTSTLIGNKRTFSDSSDCNGYNNDNNGNGNSNGDGSNNNHQNNNNNNNNNGGRSNNGVNGGWKRSKQQLVRHQHHQTNSLTGRANKVTDEADSDDDFRLKNEDNNKGVDGNAAAGRFKQTDSVLMNLLVNGCDLNAGYDEKFGDEIISNYHSNDKQRNVSSDSPLTFQSFNGVVSRTITDAVHRVRLKKDLPPPLPPPPSSRGAVDLLEPNSSRIPSLIELTEQDYAVNAPADGTLLQGSELLKALENFY